MSSSSILGIAGALVGSAFGAPQLGFMIGSAVGGYIDYSSQRSYGPRLDDLKATSSAYGTPIPYVIGAPRIAGQVWWSSDKREIATETEVGKGGGPTVTSYTYEVDMLIGLAECEIGGGTRCWSNGKLVWTDLASADDASRIASEDQNLWRRITVYRGTYDQLPDPVYEAAVGADLAPAYRGRAYVAIEGLQLGATGQLPNLTWEVCSALDASPDIVRRAAVDPIDITFADSVHLGAGHPAITAASPEVRVAAIDSALVYHFDASGQYLGSTGRTRPQDAVPPSGYPWMPAGVIDGQGVTWSATEYAYPTGSGHVFLRAGLMVDLALPLPAGRYLGGLALCSDGVHALILTAPSITYTGASVIDQWHLIRMSGGVAQLVKSGTLAVHVAVGSDFGFGGCAIGTWACCALEDDLQHVWTAFGNSTGAVKLYRIGTDDVLREMSRLDAGAGLLDWSATYPSIWAQSGFAYTISKGTYATFRRAGSDILTVPLDQAVAALCQRAGMSPEQYDVTDLAAGRPVRALAIAQVGDTRATLDQLRSAYHFEAALSDKLYFRRRASAPVLTIPWDDLAAGIDAAEPQPLAITRASDLELPAQWALQYANMADDYQPGAEYSDRTIAGQASATMMQLGLGLTPAEAKGVVDAIALDALAGLTTTSIALPLSYARLEPADVLQAIDDDGIAHRFRVAKRQDASGILKLDLVGDDAAAVVSAQITATDYAPQTTVQTASDTVLYALDIPLLRDRDDGPGYYVAARGATATWPGATVYGSANGADYTTLVTVAESAVMGAATTTLGDWTGGAVVDDVNTITINVAHGQLASTTREALLADESANALLVGDEIIRFMVATLVSTGPNVYTLSRLLRGQRGTEWASTGHAAAERVVLLRARGLRHVELQASDLQRARSLKAVTQGKSAADVTPAAFTCDGVALMPLAPVNLRAAPGDGGTYTLTWDRRSRLAVIRDDRGTTIPLGETAEAYEIDVFDAGASLVATYTTGINSVTTGQPARLLQYAAGMDWPGEHGGDLYGMQYAYDGRGGRALQRFDGASGLLLAMSSAIAGRVHKVVYTGAGVAYAIAIETDASDTYATAAKLYRIDLATLAIGTPYDLMASVSRYADDLCWDGTHVWTASATGGTVELRRHDATTLAVTATHSLGATSNTGSLTIAADGAGTIYIGRIDYNKIKAYTPGTTTTVWTVTYSAVGQLLWAGALLFADIAGPTSIDPATGAVLVSATDEAFGRMVLWGSDAAYWRRRVTITPAGTTYSGDIVHVLDGATGALSQSFPLAADDLAVIGEAAGNLLVRSMSPSGGATTVAHQYGPAAVLAGGSARVYQISATVGRGYPAIINL